jgi:small subunit ribosomal protein S7
MPRKVTKSLKRVLPADRKYDSVLVTKMINKVMWDGKKRLAENLVYKAMEQAAVKTKKEPMEVFEEAIKNVSPQVQVKSKRIGGANYQVKAMLLRRSKILTKWLRQTKPLPTSPDTNG